MPFLDWSETWLRGSSISKMGRARLGCWALAKTVATEGLVFIRRLALMRWEELKTGILWEIF